MEGMVPLSPTAITAISPIANATRRRSVQMERRQRDDDAHMKNVADLTAYDGLVVFVELSDGSELAGPASVVGDRLDVFGRIVRAAEVVAIEAL